MQSQASLISLDLIEKATSLRELKQAIPSSSLLHQNIRLKIQEKRKSLVQNLLDKCTLDNLPLTIDRINNLLKYHDKSKLITKLSEDFCKNTHKEIQVITQQREDKIKKQRDDKQIKSVEEAKTIDDMVIIEKRFHSTVSSSVQEAIQQQWATIIEKIKKDEKISNPIDLTIKSQEIKREIAEIKLKIKTFNNQLEPLKSFRSIKEINSIKKDLLEPFKNRKKEWEAILPEAEENEERQKTIYHFKNAKTFEELVIAEHLLKEIKIEIPASSRPEILFQHDLIKEKCDILNLRDTTSIDGVEKLTIKAEEIFFITKEKHKNNAFFTQVEDYYQLYKKEAMDLLSNKIKREELFSKENNPFCLAEETTRKETTPEESTEEQEEERPKEEQEAQQEKKEEKGESSERKLPERTQDFHHKKIFSKEEIDCDLENEYQESIAKLDRFLMERHKNQKNPFFRALPERAKKPLAIDRSYESNIIPEEVKEGKEYYPKPKRRVEEYKSIPLKKRPRQAPNYNNSSNSKFILFLRKNKNNILLGLGITTIIILSIFTAGVVPAAIAGASFTGALLTGLAKIASVVSALCFGLLAGSAALGVGGTGLGLVSATSPWWISFCFKKIKHCITSSREHEMSEVSSDKNTPRWSNRSSDSVIYEDLSSVSSSDNNGYFKKSLSNISLKSIPTDIDKDQKEISSSRSSLFSKAKPTPITQNRMPKKPPYQAQATR